MDEPTKAAMKMKAGLILQGKQTEVATKILDFIFKCFQFEGCEWHHTLTKEHIKCQVSKWKIERFHDGKFSYQMWI